MGRKRKSCASSVEPTPAAEAHRSGKTKGGNSGRKRKTAVPGTAKGGFWSRVGQSWTPLAVAGTLTTAASKGSYKAAGKVTGVISKAAKTIASAQVARTQKAVREGIRNLNVFASVGKVYRRSEDACKLANTRGTACSGPTGGARR